MSIQDERQFFITEARPTLDITLKKKNVSEEAPVRDKLKQDTPVNCAYLMCVHNAYLAEIWLGYT